MKMVRKSVVNRAKPRSARVYNRSAGALVPCIGEHTTTPFSQAKMASS